MSCNVCWALYPVLLKAYDGRPALEDSSERYSGAPAGGGVHVTDLLLCLSLPLGREERNEGPKTVKSL